ncbi:MAG: segregation/condensation protein A [bacterium]|nr:segregation/condensation protein A [bacterium]
MNMPSRGGKERENHIPGASLSLSLPRSEYRVVLDIFEGPMDVLMHLIRKEKINIYDIPIAKITDQYLAFLETMTTLNLDITSEFLVMAATLIYLKSQTLLSPKEPHEEEEFEERKKELVDRLVEYQQYKEAAEYLLHLANEHSRIFPRPPLLDQPDSLPGGDLFIPGEVGIFDLVLAFRNVLQAHQQTQEPSIPLKIDTIDIKDKIEQILVFLQLYRSAHFEELLEGRYERYNMVVTFLALLEMARTGIIHLQQLTPFGKILISITPGDMKYLA